MSLEDWMSRNLERLAHAQVSVPRRYSLHTYPEITFPRECFLRACYYVEQHRIKGALYVLGEALCGGIQQHAWVELPGNIVFDGVIQRFYDQDKYYASERARPWYRFTRTAAIWLHKQRLGTYRWDVPLNLPWADFRNPMTIDKASAQKYLTDANRDQRLATSPTIKVTETLDLLSHLGMALEHLQLAESESQDERVGDLVSTLEDVYTTELDHEDEDEDEVEV